MNCSGNCGSCLQNSLPISAVRKEIDKFEYSEEMSKPYIAILGVTARCNLSCPYCFVSQHNSDMDLNTAIAAVEMAINNAPVGEKPEIVFFGGEPLLRYNEIIVPIIEKYQGLCSYSITTNGVLLDENKVDFFLQNEVGVLLSFDGVREVQDTQRPGKNFSSFDKIVNNIPYLLFRMPNTMMRATVTKDSIKYMYESFMFGKEIGFKNFAFAINAFDDWTIDDAMIYKEQMDKIAEETYRSAISSTKLTFEPILRVHGLQSAINHYDKICQGTAKMDNTVYRCGTGTTSFSVCPNGDITTCQEKISNPTTIIGNVFDGIDREKHKKYLEFYFNSLSKLKCKQCCDATTQMMCLQCLCPSRLEDQDFEIKSAVCLSEQVLVGVAARLWKLTHHSILPQLKYGFGLEGDDIC